MNEYLHEEQSKQIPVKIPNAHAFFTKLLIYYTMIMVMLINDYFVYQYDHGVQKELGAQAKNFIISQPLCAPLVDVLDTVELE